jgi:hypothetical protein
MREREGHVPIEAFGADHWSTFGYLEVRVVDHGGVVRRENLRVIHRRHPAFAHEGGDASKYPTRLRGGQKLFEHDDWDCLDDFETAGLAKNVGTGVNPVYRLTDKGREIAGLLRGHKGAGRSWAEFFVGDFPADYLNGLREQAAPAASHSSG